MTDFMTFLANMPSWQKLLWIVAVLLFCWLLEYARPLRKFSQNRTVHTRTNLTLLVFTLLINLVFSAAMFTANHWANSYHFGVLYVINLPLWASLLISLLVLDLVAQYCAHYMLHQVPWLFRFHMVHHSDTSVDVTTGTRLHPIDYALRETLSLVVVVILGMPLSYYLLYRLMTIFFTYYSHANIRLPSFLDNALALVFITPNLHKFHHHKYAHWTDSNYGNILSIWDRLFGTFVQQNVDDVIYGLDVTDDDHSDDLAYQLSIPFNKAIKPGGEANTA